VSILNWKLYELGVSEKFSRRKKWWWKCGWFCINVQVEFLRSLRDPRCLWIFSCKIERRSILHRNNFKVKFDILALFNSSDTIGVLFVQWDDSQRRFNISDEINAAFLVEYYWNIVLKRWTSFKFTISIGDNRRNIGGLVRYCFKTFSTRLTSFKLFFKSTKSWKFACLFTGTSQVVIFCRNVKILGCRYWELSLCRIFRSDCSR
jgi:hypothetical protein